MKIVIAGAGDMGSHLAKMLSGNGHDITVADPDAKALTEVGNLADVITVEGDTTSFSVLRKAARASATCSSPCTPSRTTTYSRPSWPSSWVRRSP